MMNSLEKIKGMIALEIRAAASNFTCSDRGFANELRS
jgi:hypothetical protein